MLRPSIFGADLFDGFFDDFASHNAFAGFQTPVNGVMKTDVKEHEKAFELDIELPGYSKEDVKAKLKDGYLTITAEKKTDNDQKDADGKYIRRERYYGSCSRSFYVGKDVTQDDIKAKFDNGVLVIGVPKVDKKPELEQSHYISIEG